MQDDIRLIGIKRKQKQSDRAKDVFFLIDNSGFVSDVDFSIMVSAVRRAISCVNQPNSQFAIYCFHNATTTLCTMTFDKEEAINKIQNYKRSGTATHLALIEVKKLFIRRGVKRQLFLLTGGAPVNIEATITAADVLKKMNVEIIGIGIGLSPSTEQTFRQICSQNQMFVVDQFEKIEQTLRTELWKKVIQDYSLLVTVKVEKENHPISFGKELKLSVYFRNNGKKTIPSGTKMVFLENEYFTVTHVFVNEDIILNTRVEVQLKSKGVDDPLKIPDYLEVSFDHDNPNIALHCDYSAFELRSDIFIKDILNAHSPLQEIDFFNILCFGVVGSGKSSFINAILMALSKKKIDPAAVGGSHNFVTNKITKFNISQVSGLEGCTINLYDIWGLKDGGYSNNLLLTILNGELPLNFKMRDDRVYFGEELKVAKWNAYERRIHSVLIFMPYNILNDSRMKLALDYNLQICSIFFQTHPIVIVTRASHAGDENDQNILKKKLSEEFNIPEITIYMVDNYTEQRNKTMSIDKKTLAILKQIIKNCDIEMKANKKIIKKQYEKSFQRQV